MSKDSHVSPSESISHSVEERRSSGELKSLSDDHPEVNITLIIFCLNRHLRALYTQKLFFNFTFENVVM
jgi:hypothetical protein